MMSSVVVVMEEEGQSKLSSAVVSASMHFLDWVEALELLKSIVAAVVVKESAEVILRSGKKKHEKEEIQSFDEELEAIKKAFIVKNEGKHLWAGLFSAATILVVVAAYIAKGR